MSLINDVRKTINYAGRNGAVEAYYAAMERMRSKVGSAYEYDAPSQEELKRQRDEYASLEEQGAELPSISILVPLYMPDMILFEEMIISVMNQTYGNWELVIADGSPDDSAEETADKFECSKIAYYHLDKNGGISYNTNAAAAHAHGKYIALLDYDDLLAEDAIYEITKEILENEPEIIYSDEDKCDISGKKFFEPNIKPDFNPDYFLANNYICHLTVMQTELFRALKLRSDYDGAQDYDLLLRAPWSGIRHIRKVLYHWRTHAGSTAGNPASKNYAYEAGLRALEDYLRVCRIKATVTHSRHRGFYNINYIPDIFEQRDDVGIVGGKVLDKNRRIVGGMMDAEGNVFFKGMHELESGPMHRADTRQDAEAVDVRCMQIRDSLRGLYQDVFNADYDEHVFKGNDDLTARSIEFCKRAREKGYLVLWDPSMTYTIR